MPFRILLSSAPADDLIPVGSGAQHGFVSLVRANLALGLARRGLSGVVVDRDEAEPAGAQAAGPAETADFGRLLKRFRLEAGLSQESLAERARMSVNGISSLERGNRRSPQRQTFQLLVDALQLDAPRLAAFETAARRGHAAAAHGATGANETAIPPEILITVVSPASAADERCASIIARFANTWRERNLDERLIAVYRARTDHAAAPELLAARPNVRFYLSSDAREEAQTPLYRNDGTASPAFYDAVEALADVVVERATTLGIATAPRKSRAMQSDRAVFVALPAPDMDLPYRTVVAELRSAGYDVLPESAVSELTVDDLARCVCSIHLLGESQDVRSMADREVGAQLERAASRAKIGNGDGFARIIFAPKVFVDEASGGVAHGARDPIATRDRFTLALDSDTIVGDGINDFVVAAKELVKNAIGKSAVPPRPLRSGSSVFIDFHPQDTEYARLLSIALRERGIRPRFAACEDDRIQNRLTNTALVRDADAVVYCWANATDAWLYSEAADYADWQKLGREIPFVTRAAVAGPPVRVTKKLYSEDSPPDSIDVFVNLTDRERPLAGDLDPLVHRLPSAETT